MEEQRQAAAEPRCPGRGSSREVYRQGASLLKVESFKSHEAGVKLGGRGANSARRQFQLLTHKDEKLFPPGEVEVTGESPQVIEEGAARTQLLPNGLILRAREMERRVEEKG
jgi:hypothetical protein